MMLTLSEDRDGGGVFGAFVPTLSEDLQRETSVDAVNKILLST